ncbi:MAG: TIGR01906 family membrane protein [Anaerolineae bacterium]|jgi:integral membrane protein (TIGR01906 family)|nr:TIGR01906 family membrane protein [Anaerolineae bacterium]
MSENKNKLQTLIPLIVAVLTPLFVIIFSVRLVTTPLMARIQYNLPGFPDDPYGFTKEERLEYSKPSILYLTNNAGIEYLADLTFEDGTPIYNERELSHMLDVKNLFTAIFNVWYGVTLVLGALLIWCHQTGKWVQFRKALKTGGITTIGALVAFGILTAIDFEWLFTQFHYIFFTGDTWLFKTSDTLIRLFPLPFWLIAMVLILALTLIFSALLIWQGNRVKEG